jgi:amino acid transporter
VFGEAEFWFASVKIVAIVGLLVGGLVVIFFGVGPAGGTATFANLFSVDAPGTAGGFPPFGVVGLLFAIQIAVFSYQGAELVGMTAVETRDRERTIPKAINSVPLRIILFYVGSLAVLMSVIPWTSFNSDDSPFVQALAQIGVPVKRGRQGRAVWQHAGGGADGRSSENGRSVHRGSSRSLAHTQGLDEHAHRLEVRADPPVQASRPRGVPVRDPRPSRRL